MAAAAATAATEKLRPTSRSSLPGGDAGRQYAQRHRLASVAHGNHNHELGHCNQCREPRLRPGGNEAVKSPAEYPSADEVHQPDSSAELSGKPVHRLVGAVAERQGATQVKHRKRRKIST